MSIILDDGKLSIVGADGSKGISAKQLDGLIHRHLDEEVEILIVFAQCYGGNMAKSKFFRTRANTCVLSGTNSGQEAGYGGYHDDAARALQPGEGRTASDIHEAGIAGLRALYPEGSNEARLWNEEPVITGGLAPEQFSLAPTSPDGPVAARQIVIYSAQPEFEDVNSIVSDRKTIPMEGRGREVRVGDALDRDRIIKNFQEDSETIVRTVGGEANPKQPELGIKGWHAPGTEAALSEAIHRAGGNLGQAQGTGKRQFVLFVGDHGVGTRRNEFDTILASADTETALLDDITPFEDDSAFIASIKRCKNAVPGFELIIEIPAGFDPYSGADFPIKGDDLTLNVGPVSVSEFVWTFQDSGDPARHPDEAAQSIRLIFGVERSAFLKAMGSERLMVSLHNRSSVALNVHGFVQATGSVGRSTGPLKGILPAFLGGWFWHKNV